MQTSFISLKQGWANISGRIFATDDGGVTWDELKVGGPWPEGPSVCVPAEPFPPKLKPN